MMKLMIKFLPLIVLLSAVLGVFAYFYIFKQAPQASLNTEPVTQESGLEKRVKTLEGAVVQLADKTGNSEVSETVNNSANTQDLSTRLNAIEVSIADLRNRVKTLEGGSSATPLTNTTTSTTTTTTKQAPAYILSLGSGSSTTSQDWVVASNIDITIDPASYPGYTNMQLEAQVKVLSGNGKVYARLYDSTAGTAVLLSEVSTAAENYSWVSSQTFSPGTAKKTYKFQIKSLTGYEAAIQAARIKVNF